MHFKKWLKSFPENKRFCAVCGSNKPLVDYVVRSEIMARKKLGFQILSIDEEVFKSLQDVLMQRDLVETRKVFVVHGFKGKKLSIIESVLESGGVDVIMDIDVKSIGKDSKLALLCKKFGRVVQCGEIGDLSGFVKRLYPMSDDAADALVDVTAGNVIAIINEVKKISFVRDRISSDDVWFFSASLIDTSLVNFVFGKRFESVLGARGADFSKTSKVIGLFELQMRRILHVMLLRDMKLIDSDLAKKAKIPYFVANTYLKAANQMTPDSVFRRIQLLAKMDAYLKQGVCDGLLERLLCVW